MTCIEGGPMLFEQWNALQRGRLLASGFGRLLPGEKVVDLFCGAGGWDAALKRIGINVDYAINHWPVAISTHQLNYPRCRAHQGDSWRTPPESVVGDDAIGLLVASAACTTHSPARGAAPISPRVHMLGWCIARWMKDKRPRMVLIENVPAWKTWGPTIVKRDAAGRPVRDGKGRLIRMQDPARAGREFRRWWRYCERLGYVMEMREADAVDFGSASRRKRLFVQGRLDGQAIAWPEVTHGAEPGPDRDRPILAGGAKSSGVRYRGSVDQDGRGKSERDNARGVVPPSVADRSRGADAFGSCAGHQAVKRNRCAADIIDWSDLGTSIFSDERKAKGGLAEKTCTRLARGVGRFVIDDPRPFVLRLSQPEGGGGHVYSVDQPLATQTARQDLGLCTPIVMQSSQSGSGGIGSRPADQPLPTLTTCEDMMLASPVMVPCGGPKREPSLVVEPAHTVLTREDRGIATPVMIVSRNNCDGSDVRGPVNTVTAGGLHHAIATPLLREYYGCSDSLKRVDDPLGCVVTKDRFGIVSPVLGPTIAGMRGRALETAAFLKKYLGEKVRINAEGFAVVFKYGVEYVIVDILFRMLRVRELAAAMGFPADYHWPKSQRDAVKCIGNAVQVDHAEALLRALMPEYGERSRKAVVA